ncbi:DUF5719 family protein [Specibacter sp. NPDC057265]|uniref:DUF5719 family protein n=1 Tax=Specibacter sp. NPDC057265 TaxID=3346075 RepID=UPI003626A36F
MPEIEDDNVAASKQSGTRRSPAARRSKSRRWPAVVSGAGTLLVAAALVGAGSIFPGTNATEVVPPVPHPVPVGETMANCQGPTQLLAGSANGTDPQFSANSSATKSQLNAVVLSNAAGTVPGATVESLDGSFTSLLTVAKAPVEQAEAAPTELTGKPKVRAAVVRGSAAAAPSVVRVQPLNQQASQGSGSVVVSADDGDLQGMAAAACQLPANELWFAGASTTVGRTAVLMVSNSSASPATVSLELFSKDGQVQAAGSKGLVVPSGTVRSVVLAGLAPGQEVLSVHLKSTGGAVSAVIQQSVLRGLTPGGVDYLAPTQMPSSTPVIPGVRVQSQDVAGKISGQSGYGDAATALAISVPGVRDAVVEVRAFGPDGQAVLPNGGVFTAKGAAVSLFPLAGLPAGSYTLTLNSDNPVVAAARSVNSTGTGKAVDLAWMPAAERLGSGHLLTVPQDVEAQLVFTAPEGAATVQLVSISGSGVLGQAQDVELKKSLATTVDPATLGKDTAAVLVSASGSAAYGAQVLTRANAADLAVLPVTGAGAGAPALNITTGF